jgi:hypothetical protein
VGPGGEDLPPPAMPIGAGGRLGARMGRQLGRHRLSAIPREKCQVRNRRFGTIPECEP